MARKAMELERPAERWAVVYRPRRRKGVVPELWMVVTDAPAGLREAEVLAALEETAWWPMWQRRIAPGAHISATVERRWSAWMRAAVETAYSGGGAGADALRSWDQLAPESRRLSIPVGPGLYAAIRRASADAGMSMQAWAAQELAAALERRDDAGGGAS